MKKILTPEIAKKLAKETFEKIENEEDKDFLIIHSFSVVQCSLILAEDKNIDKNILEIAGWLHDLGYIINKEDHAKHSLEILEKEYEINEKLKDCILNHGSDGKPETSEGEIIKVADKLSCLNPDLVKILVKYSLKKDKQQKEKDLEFIRKMCNKGIDLMKEFD